MARRRPALLLPGLLLNALLSGGTFLVAKGTVREFPPLVLALLRFVLATAVLWPAVRLLRPHKRIAPSDRAQLWWLGLLAVPLNQGLFLYGIQWASASHAALLYALTPSFVLLIGVARGERPSMAQIVGIAIAFGGVVLLLVQRGLHADPHSLPGDLLVFMAAIAWAGYVVAGRRLTRRYGPLIVTSEALLAGTILFLPIGLASLIGWQPSGISLGGWLGLGYLAWLTSALNYVLWFWGLEYLKPTTVSMVTNLQPIIAAALARVFLHEELPPGFLLSMALVLGGVWLTRVERIEKPTSADHT